MLRHVLWASLLLRFDSCDSWHDATRDRLGSSSPDFDADPQVRRLADEIQNAPAMSRELLQCFRDDRVQNAAFSSAPARGYRFASREEYDGAIEAARRIVASALTSTSRQRENQAFCTEERASRTLAGLVTSDAALRQLMLYLALRGIEGVDSARAIERWRGQYELVAAFRPCWSHGHDDRAGTVRTRPRAPGAKTAEAAYAPSLEAISIVGDVDGFFREGRPVFEPVTALFEIGKPTDRSLAFVSEHRCAATWAPEAKGTDLHVRFGNHTWAGPDGADTALATWPVRVVEPSTSGGVVIELVDPNGTTTAVAVDVSEATDPSHERVLVRTIPE
jgi:hypothetical protein